MPKKDKTCSKTDGCTHWAACSCREETFAEVVAALEKAVEALKSVEWEISIGAIVQAEKALKKAKGEK